MYQRTLLLFSMTYSFSARLTTIPNCRGLDNKVTVYPLSFEDDVSQRKKAVGTHTSYMSCCLFPNSDQQVGVYYANVSIHGRGGIFQ